MSLLRTKSTKSMRDISCVLQAKETINPLDTPLSTPTAPKSIDVFQDSSRVSAASSDNRSSGIMGWIQRRLKSGSRKGDSATSAAIRPSLSMTSRMSYFQDRLLAPESMFTLFTRSSDARNGTLIPEWISSPVQRYRGYVPLARPSRARGDARAIPTHLLFNRYSTSCNARPSGEKDPLVDDTVVFAARIRNAKESARMAARHTYMRRRHASSSSAGSTRSANSSLFDAPSGASAEDYDVHVKILEGFSHAFFNMVQFALF